eukprot:6191421-Pleurochrysis_carterae.AAC.9
MSIPSAQVIAYLNELESDAGQLAENSGSQAGAADVVGDAVDSGDSDEAAEVDGWGAGVTGGESDEHAAII